MQHEVMAAAVKEFNGVLRSLIPFVSQIERMGIQREPVAASSPESVALKAYKNLWKKIQETVIL